MKSNISERDFRGIDLNLLVTLLVLLREKSVSRAAERLYLGQPAVSGALSRLRQLFDDKLLVRTGGAMVPTPRALQLQAVLAPALGDIQGVISNRSVFDPKTVSRTLRLGMPDWVDLWLLSPLLAVLSKKAPELRVAVIETDQFRVSEMLARDDIDMAIGPFAQGPPWLRRHLLRTLQFRCVARAAVMGKRPSITLKKFIALPHILVSYRGAFEGVVDRELAAIGLRRNVAYTNQRFSSLPRVLQDISAIATVPEALTAIWQRDFGLSSAAAPVKLPSIEVAIAHHSTRDKDLLIQWICNVVQTLVGASTQL